MGYRNFLAGAIHAVRFLFDHAPMETLPIRSCLIVAVMLWSALLRPSVL